jgi:hypothetical protein
VPVCAVPYDEGEKPPKASSVLTFQGATRNKGGAAPSRNPDHAAEGYLSAHYFLSHGKYLYTAKVFQLHVPTAKSSLMFTHLPSRSVFIDEDRVGSDEASLYWMAHELGHLTTNSAREDVAEKAAREYRKRLKEAEMAAPKEGGRLAWEHARGTHRDSPNAVVRDGPPEE